MIRFLILGTICVSMLFALQVTYAEGDFSVSERDNIKKWFAISAVLLEERQFEEAISYLDRILKVEPDNIRALSNKAGALIQVEKFSESLDISNKVLKAEPDRITTLINKAIALKMLKEYESSYLVFTKILTLDTNEERIETVKKARANLLSGTPTISTNESKFDVHTLVTIRNVDGNLIGVVESTNARFLDSKFTEVWWNLMIKADKISLINEQEIYHDNQIMLPGNEHLGMLTLERVMSGYNINLFEVFTPMIELEESDKVDVQWTIIRN